MEQRVCLKSPPAAAATEGHMTQITVLQKGEYPTLSRHNNRNTSKLTRSEWSRCK